MKYNVNRGLFKVVCLCMAVCLISLSCFGDDLLAQAKNDGLRNNLLKINSLSQNIVKLAINDGKKPTNNEIKTLINSLKLKYLVKSFKIGEYDLGGEITLKYTVKFNDDKNTLFNESLLKLVNGQIYKKNKKCSNVIASMSKADIKMAKGYGEGQSASSSNWGKVKVYDKQKLAKLLDDFKKGKISGTEMMSIMQQEIAKGNVLRYRLRSNPMIVLSNGEQLN